MNTTEEHDCCGLETIAVLGVVKALVLEAARARARVQVEIFIFCIVCIVEWLFDGDKRATVGKS
jgi:hypothetical protein